MRARTTFLAENEPIEYLEVEISQLKELGMTKAELARALGIRVQTVYKWKRLPGYVEGFLLLMSNREAALQAMVDINQQHGLYAVDDRSVASQGNNNGQT